MSSEREALTSALADLERSMAQTQGVLSDAGSTYATFRRRI